MSVLTAPWRILVEYPGVALHEALHAAVARATGADARFCGPRGDDCLDGRWHVHLDFKTERPPRWQLYAIYWAPWLLGVLGAVLAVRLGVSDWLLGISPLAWGYLAILWVRASIPSLSDLFPRAGSPVNDVASPEGS